MALQSSSYKVLTQRNYLNPGGGTPVGLFNFGRSPFLRSLGISRAVELCTCSGGNVLSSSKRRSRGPIMAAKKAAEGVKQEDGKYKDTVNLPKTAFGMRANSTVKEPEIQKLWDDNQVFKRVVDRNNGGTFVLHDGPPYANGDLHIGHALNKILKDMINRYKLLQNLKVHYVPGWDCHGLPIELKVLQSLDQDARKELTPLKLRAKAAKFAKDTVKKQMASFKRYGVWGNWDAPYLTLDPEYEAAQINVFGQMALQGYIYRGRKPVHWSPSSSTALAEAELEYPEGHISRSIYAIFRVVGVPPESQGVLEEFLPDLCLAVWTTTPWTMPANAAVAVNAKLHYAVVELNVLEQDASSTKTSKRKLGTVCMAEKKPFIIVAVDLVETLESKWGMKLTIKKKILGSDLEGCRYIHPIDGRKCPVVVGGDYITTESGTGLVHTAPGHGQEDYITGQKYGLPLISPVDDSGRFTEEAGKFSGLDVLGDGNVAVIKSLDEGLSLIMEEPYKHKYPYDWRTKKPTIFRATEQWFASVEGFREAAMDAISKVAWVPTQAEKRISSMTSGRSDWCISRQRSWGVPIPVFYHKVTKEPLMNEETIEYIKGIISQKGSDAWWYMKVEELLPVRYRDSAPEYEKGSDTMDVWFDSGSSWAAVLEKTESLSYPADLYLEGSDQHRGWFQSSLLTSIATKGKAPYLSVVTHGFVLDEKGLKMSKSVGNVVDPALVIEGNKKAKNQTEAPAYGADVLRLWVSSVDYTGDVLIGPQILRQMSDIYRKLRGTLRYILGNLHDWIVEDTVPYDDIAVECVVGSSSNTNEWSSGGVSSATGFLQTGDIVEEIRIGEVVLRSPFKNGRSGVQKILRSSYQNNQTSIVLRFRPASRNADAAPEARELQAWIVPSESAKGMNKQYVLRITGDPLHDIRFFDCTESECLELQASSSSRIKQTLTTTRVQDGYESYPWEKKMLPIGDSSSFLSILIFPKAVSDDDNKSPRYNTVEDTLARANAWLHASESSGVPITCTNVQTESLLTKISGDKKTPSLSSITDLPNLANVSLYGLEDYHGVDIGIVRAVRLWYSPIGGEYKVTMDIKEEDTKLGFVISRTEEVTLVPV